MWTLPEAVDVIRSLQFKALQFGYHLALAGGVLNKGMSENDLDIVVMPLDQRSAQREPFLVVAAKYLGTPIEVKTGDPMSAPSAPSQNLYRFTRDGRITDLLFYQR